MENHECVYEDCYYCSLLKYAKPLKCIVCGAEFTVAGDLEQHILESHVRRSTHLEDENRSRKWCAWCLGSYFWDEASTSSSDLHPIQCFRLYCQSKMNKSFGDSQPLSVPKKSEPLVITIDNENVEDSKKDNKSIGDSSETLPVSNESEPPVITIDNEDVEDFKKTNVVRDRSPVKLHSEDDDTVYTGRKRPLKRKHPQLLRM